MRRIALTLAAAVLLSGCGSGYDDMTAPPREPRVPGPTDTLVVYERSGGVAGIRERLAVRPDGAARLETGGAKLEVQRFDLDPAELEGLRAAVDAVDFAQLEPRYGEEPPPPDTFATTVAAEGRTVAVLHEGDPSAELRRLMNVCAGLVQVHRRR
jgi:hypothetical protein